MLGRNLRCLLLCKRLSYLQELSRLEFTRATLLRRTPE